MGDPIAESRDFTELLELGEHGPYVFTRMFSTEGRRARHRSKRTLELLKRIDRPLREMLHEGERVFFVTRGVAQPSVIEWYLLGAALYYLNRRALVFTDRRIVLIQIDWRERVRPMRDEISYAAIAALEGTWFGDVRITFKTGARLRLAGLPRVERKWLVPTFERLLTAFEETSARSGLEHLCPHCHVRLQRNAPACPACGGALKSAKTAALLSLLYPGAGDLYLGHRGFAYLEILGVSMIWLVIALLAIDLTVGLAEIVVLLGITIPMVHGFDAFTTHRIATKGLLPHDGAPPHRRVVAAAIVPALVLLGFTSTLPSRLRLRPAPGVVSGEALPGAHRAALERAGYLDPGERVRYFHSLGPASVLQHGSIFADDRVVSYGSGYEGTWRESALLSDVVDLDFAPADPREPVSYVTVVREDGSGLVLTAPTEDAGHQVFSLALLDRWLAVRAQTPGPWFDGGSGHRPEDAVIVRGAVDPAAADSLQLWWLSTWYGEEGTDWTLVERLAHPEEELHEWRLAFGGGGQGNVFFRVAGAP